MFDSVFAFQAIVTVLAWANVGSMSAEMRHDQSAVAPWRIRTSHELSSDCCATVLI